MLKIKQKLKLYSGTFLTLWGSKFEDRNKIERMWEWIEKKDIVFILPITNNEKVILIKQYRVPVEKYVVEAPAGLLESGELAEEAARRELLEETGYEAEKFIALPITPIAPGISNNLARGFIAKNVVKVSTGKLEESEDLEVIEIEIDRLKDFCLNLPNDTLFDLRILSCLNFLK